MILLSDVTLKWEVFSNLASRIAIASTEYVRCPVVASSAGSVVNPTTFTVSFAFLTSITAEPTSGQFVAASWDTDAIGGYVAQCLVGPTGTTTLTVGAYFVWVKVATGTETVIQPVGELKVY